MLLRVIGDLLSWVYPLGLFTSALKVSHFFLASRQLLTSDLLCSQDRKPEAAAVMSVFVEKWENEARQREEKARQRIEARYRKNRFSFGLDKV